MMSTGLANAKVVCSDIEILHFDPPSGLNCSAYLSDYINVAGGYLVEPGATSDCQFCSVADTNAFLASVGSYFSQAWRNFGILWAFIIFNIAGAIFMYWLIRVPKKDGKEEKEKKE